VMVTRLWGLAKDCRELVSSSVLSHGLGKTDGDWNEDILLSGRLCWLHWKMIWVVVFRVSRLVVTVVGTSASFRHHTIRRFTARKRTLH
jgi:hypothetical protein